MAEILRPYQSHVAPVYVPSDSTLVNKHVVLVEIDWDTGTEGYAYERYRTPNLDYQDLIVSIGSISRSVSVTGNIQFPSVSISLANRDLYFSIKLHNTSHRNRVVRIKIIPPLTAVSHAVTVMEGKISRMRLSNGVMDLDVIGTNFEEIFGSNLSDILPVLDKHLFTDMPVDQVPSLLPLIYGEIDAASGEDLEEPDASGAVQAFLIDTDGNSNTTWVSRTNPEDNSWNSVIWADDQRIGVAVASTGTNRVMRTTDGVTWTAQSAASAITWNDVTYSPELNLFVAVGSGGASTGDEIMTSSDGITWANQTYPGPDIFAWRCVTWSPELTLFVAVASNVSGNTVITSPDGTTWTLRTPAANKTWEDIAWSPELGLFVVVGSSASNSDAMTSPDGSNWTLRTTPSESAKLWKDVAWSPKLGIFAACGQGGSLDRVMVSEDGITWLLASTSSSLGTFLGISWSPDLEMFAVVASGGEVAVSEDGVEWTAHTAAAANNWNSVAWAPHLGIWIAVSSTGTGNRIMTSPTALTNKFLYAVGARPILGDFNSWLAQPGKITLVYRFGERVFSKKTTTATTFGNFTIPVIGFAVDQRAASERGDTPEITFFATGVTDNNIAVDAASVDPIRNPIRAREDFLRYYSSLPESMLDQTSHDAAKILARQQHLADAGTAGVAPPALGAVIRDMNSTLLQVLQTFDKSFAMITYQTRTGQLGILVSPIGADPTPTVTVTDESDILRNTLVIDDFQDSATGFNVLYSFRWTHGQQGDPNPGSQYARRILYDIPGAKRDLKFPNNVGITKDLDLPYCRRTAAALNVIRAYSEYYRPKSQYLTFELPIAFFNQIDIGDYVGITHWQGTSTSGGFNAITARITGITVNPVPENPSITVAAFKRQAGVVVHDNFDRSATSNDLGSSWFESEEAANRLSIISVSAYEGSTFNQINGLQGFVSSGANYAFWNVTTENDQNASIETIHRDGSSNTTWGAGVRMSGLRTGFTGYVGLAKYTTSGPALTLELRKYVNANVGGGSQGTLLGSYTLTVPTFTTNPWRSQGDVIEVRATGNRIELFFWSDIAANNIGRAIAVTDTAITSGNFGIFVDVATTIVMTNFYGRGY